MNLIEKQKIFAKLLIELLGFALNHGYEITLGEAWRSYETDQLYKKMELGIPNSLHTLRLAIDLNLFKDGKYLTRTEEYSEIGEFWENLSTNNYQCCWGGRFEDGNHFSISHNGIK